MSATNAYERFRKFAHEEAWDITGFSVMNQRKEPFREAYAEILARILGKYIGAKDRILEVGSGLGWLAGLVPQYAPQITQTEKSEELVAHARRNNQSANINKEDIHNLTFNDGSFDTVIGLGVYDVLRNLTQACAETRRVLRRGGRFIHFLDQKPDPNPLIEDYQKDGHYAFPGTDGGSEVGFHLISISDFPIVCEVLAEDLPDRPYLVPLMKEYINDPAMMYIVYFSLSPEAVSKVAEILNQIADDRIIKKTPSQIDLFQTKLTKGLASNGFRILETSSPSAELSVLRRNLDPQFSRFNTFWMNNGTMTAYNLDLPRDQMFAKANMNVVVAEAI